MFGIVAINGNWLSRIEEILQNFDYWNYSKLDSFDKYNVYHISFPIGQPMDVLTDTENTE